MEKETEGSGMGNERGIYHPRGGRTLRSVEGGERREGEEEKIHKELAEAGEVGRRTRHAGATKGKYKSVTSSGSARTSARASKRPNSSRLKRGTAHRGSTAPGKDSRWEYCDNEADVNFSEMGCFGLLRYGQAL